MTAEKESCRKIRYASRAAARQMRGRFRGIRDPGRLRAYFCDECQAWHLGNLGPDVKSGEQSRAEAYGGS